MKKPSKAEVRRALHRNFLFGDLTTDELNTLLDHIWLESVPNGTTMVHEDEDANELYLIVDGGVNVTKAPGQFLSYLGRDGFFGEMALFTDGAKRTANCITASDSTCAIIRKQDLEVFCNREPQAGMKIYRAMVHVLSERLQATSADLAMLMKAQVGQQEDVSSLVEKAKRIKAQKLK